jgi:hypothetical protein
MKIRERIELSGTPFPNPLPKPAEEIINYFNQYGYIFDDHGRYLVLDQLYSRNRYDQILELIKANNLDVKTRHSIWPIYEEKDFEKADLLTLLFPDLWVDEINFENVCSTCKKKNIKFNYDVRVSSVNTSKPIVTINGQFSIVNKTLKKAMEEDLKGGKFYPFDEEDKYFYLSSNTHLGSILMKSEETINLGDRCSECGTPKFDMFFGPLRYSAKNWNDEDIVRGEFYDNVLFSHKAYDLLKKFEKEIQRNDIVILE